MKGVEGMEGMGGKSWGGRDCSGVVAELVFLVVKSGLWVFN
jgi:predicted alpha/beta-hydrolase family hydrolase